MNTTHRIRLAIADDHQIVIDGLAAALKNYTQLEIAVTANTGEDLLKKLEERSADILLTDMLMPGMSGQELSGHVRRRFPDMRIIALSMSGSGHVVDELIRDIGIDGYVLKQCGIGELVSAIETVHEGGSYFQPSVLEELARHAKLQQQVASVRLTLREKQIIILLEKDLSNKQISSHLSISVRTVETHRKNILRKTGTSNVLTLTKWAYEHHIL